MFAAVRARARPDLQVCAASASADVRHCAVDEGSMLCCRTADRGHKSRPWMAWVDWDRPHFQLHFHALSLAARRERRGGKEVAAPRVEDLSWQSVYAHAVSSGGPDAERFHAYELLVSGYCECDLDRFGRKGAVHGESVCVARNLARAKKLLLVNGLACEVEGKERWGRLRVVAKLDSIR